VQAGAGRTRLAAVSYVNAWPLVAGLADDPDIAFVTATPAQVAELLRRGEVDAGLVPSIELLRQRDLQPVGGSGISAFGPVDSVLLMLRRAPHDVRTLALDPASRTSQALAVLVLEQVFGARPACFEADPGRAWAEGRADAVLVIGDRALEMRASCAPVLDLADAWTRWTGLPFVFAVWAAGAVAAATRAKLENALEAASRRGRETIGALARRAAMRGPLDEAGFQVYLSRRIRYGLGEWEMRGLRRFLELAERSERFQESPCST
jgi:predicted solute-binding protein